ncbi:MAG: HAMP domain-containing histidine kinase, partial [Tolypothrix sp. Co-bin9]|nr:HAMP domain-containing histidine kinase [Tolypothrix sp. Co-bin9]
AGKKTLNSETCNLPEMLIEVVEELNPIANDKGLTLKVDTSALEKLGENAGIVTGDRLELRRVFSNLIGNAIKFTDTGGIEARIFESAENNEKNLVTIEIEDTGYGIAAEDQATIFERFRQGRNKRAGSGLGLHLSRLIVEAHGGAIEIFSEVGKGSVFTLRLPKQSQLNN